jgi:YVTN family beta-propeller protein
MRRMSGVAFLALLCSTFIGAAPALAQLVIQTAATDLGPIAVGVNRATNRIYVANVSGSNVIVINGFTCHTATVPVGQGPIVVAVNAVTNKIYVVNQIDGSVTIIDGATNNISTVAAEQLPYAVAVDPLTNRISWKDSLCETTDVPMA